MIVITVEFSIATRFIKSKDTEEKTFEFEDDEIQSEIDFEIQCAYDEWISDRNEGGWSIIQQEIKINEV